MCESVDIARPKDKTTTQLEGISAELMVRVPSGFGASASLGIVASQQVKQVRALKFHGEIGFPLFVNEERKRNARFFAESAGIDAIPQAHSGQVRTAVAEDLFVGTQLRDVLAAENSTVMAQENYHGRLADPQ